MSAQNIDCRYSFEPPRRDGSNEYPQAMFLSINKKNDIYPWKHKFYHIKVRFKGVKIIKACSRDDITKWEKNSTGEPKLLNRSLVSILHVIYFIMH